MIEKRLGLVALALGPVLLFARGSHAKGGETLGGCELTFTVSRDYNRRSLSWTFRNRLAVPVWLPSKWRAGRMPVEFFVPPDELVFVFSAFRSGVKADRTIRPSVPHGVEFVRIPPGGTREGRIVLRLPHKRQAMLGNPYTEVSLQAGFFKDHLPWPGPVCPRWAKRVWCAAEYYFRDPNEKKTGSSGRITGLQKRVVVARELITGVKKTPKYFEEAREVLPRGLAVTKVVPMFVPFAPPGREVIEDWKRGLRHKDANVRWLAAGRLRDRGPGALPALELLAQAAKDVHPAVRANAVAALGAMGSAATQAVPVLVRALTDVSSEVRTAGADALADVGTRRADVTAALIRALKDDDSGVRGAAAAALGVVGSTEPDVVSSLARALQDPDPVVRHNATGSLCQMGTPAKRAIPALSRARHDRDRGIGLYAVVAMAVVEPTPARLAELRNLLSHKNPHMRTLAVGALGRVRPSPDWAIPAIVQAMRDPEPSVRHNAAGALGRIGAGTDQVVIALLKALDDQEWNVRVMAALSLAQLGTAGDKLRAALPWLLEASKYGDEWTRKAATAALGRLPKQSSRGESGKAEAGKAEPDR